MVGEGNYPQMKIREVTDDKISMKLKRGMM
jgi:hypothetical protein